jgi:hypothetical protein
MPSSCSLEQLERRALFSLAVQFDYSLDSSHFFDAPERRAILQAAADEVVSHLGDRLAAIVPDAGNTWHFDTFNPSTNADISPANLTIPADTLLVYVGARNMDALGLSAPADTTASGTSAWKALVAGRGQVNTVGDDAHDFGPAGGSITFASSPDGGWYFGPDAAGISGHNDFYSVAIHETCHVLGFGTADSWYSRINGSNFAGPASVAEHGGGIPISDEQGHWKSGTTDRGIETAMDPELTFGTRKTLTPLDVAGLDDVGWEVPMHAALTSSSVSATEGATKTMFKVAYTHFYNIPNSAFGSDDLIVTGPGGFTTPVTLVGTGSSGSMRTVTYQFAAPGGTFDAADVGDYTVTINPGAVSDAFGNSVVSGSLGAVAVDVSEGPAAAVSASDVFLPGGATQSIDVNYTDSSGLDASSFSTGDINVTRASDNLALAVTSANITKQTGDGTVTVTYVVAAPDGSWDATDNGTYNIALNPSQVIDVQGTPAEGGPIGSFDVAINELDFSAAQRLSFVDAGGNAVLITMSGPGSGQVFFAGPGNADVAQIILSGTTPASALTINAGGVGTTIASLTASGPLKSISGKNVDLAGAMTLAGALPKLTLRSASGSIVLNAPGAAPASITLAEATNLTITSASPIKLVKVNDWLDTDATPDVITAPSVSAVSVKGVMAAGVNVQTLGKMTVGGPLFDAEVRAAGAIGSIVVGSIARSGVFVGVADGVSDLPTSADQFTNPAATIKTFTVKSKNSGSFTDSVVAGANLGKVTVGLVTTGNAGNALGVAALTAKSATGATDAAGAFKLAKLDDPAGTTTIGDFTIRLL